MLSVDNLLTKGDSCGVDGIHVSQFREYWEMNYATILKQVWKGTYTPGEILEIEILKKNGKKRYISKYNCTDRVLQDVIKRELEVLADKDFSEYSYAYRINKGTQEAAKQAASFIEKNCLWVAELDIKDFFNNINLRRLLRILKEKGISSELEALIRKYLYVKVQNDYNERVRSKGLVQGSPISPVLSNIYLNDLDHMLEEKYHFCRFSDNINIYCENKEEAVKIAKDVEVYLNDKLDLELNKSKSGIFFSLNRSFLGFEFYKAEYSQKILIRQKQRENKNYYRSWHSSAIQRIDKNYHIINEGILTRKDYTVLFENEENKMYLPVETCGMINIYSNVSFSSQFFDFASQRKLKISIYNRYGEYQGSFVTVNHFLSTKTMLKQASIYLDESKRVEIARKIEIASLHNQRENLRYFQKHLKLESLKIIIDEMSQCIKQMNQCKTVSEMLLIEARGKQKYLQTFDTIIGNQEFRFEKRTRRPPKNEVNAMISFGNTFLYRRIATEIYKSSLDIRLGFAHAANNRSESLNLDIAEIFKPIIVDRAIFTLIHRKQILREMHFSKEENEGVYLNKSGKKVFIREMENKLYHKIKIDNRPMTYDAIICNEVRKIFRYVMYNEKYVPFKYT